MTAHDCGDQAHLAFSRRRHQVVTGRVSVTGFDAVHIQVGIPQQTVTVHLTDIIEGELFLFIDSILFRHVTDQRLTDQCHITRGAVLTFCVQTMNGLEVGILQTNRFDVVVHQVNERILAASDIVSHRNTGVITGLQHNPTGQLRNWHAVAWLQEHQRGAFEHRVAGRPGIRADGDHIVLMNFTRFNGLTNDIAGHHLGQTGRIAACISIFLCQHFA